MSKLNDMLAEIKIPQVVKVRQKFDSTVLENYPEVLMQRLRAKDIHIEPGQRTAWIQVEDTRAALQRLGSWCRKQRSLPVVGITGSVG